MSEETIKLKVSLGIGISNADRDGEIETGIPVSEWEAMTDDERQERGQKEWEEWIWEYIDGRWKVIE